MSNYHLYCTLYTLQTVALATSCYLVTTEEQRGNWVPVITFVLGMAYMSLHLIKDQVKRKKRSRGVQ